MSSITISENPCFDKTDVEVVTGTNEVLKDFSATGRARPWAKHKAESRKLLELYKKAKMLDDSLVSEKRLFALHDCASYLEFALYEDKSRKLHSANFCRMRLCPMCQWRKSLKLFSQVSDITDEILKHKPYVTFLFVTFTIKNVTGEELKDTLDKMNEAFKAIVQDKKKYLASAMFRENLLGYMKAIEVTYNSDENTFHPHIHAIFEVKPAYFSRGYLSHKKWRLMWQELMKLDYAPMVNVKSITSKRSKAIAEVAKYPVKSEGLLKLKDIDQAARALVLLHKGIYKRQFVTFGGDFKEFKQLLNLDDIETGDLIHVETDISTKLNPIAYVLFTYRADAGAYIC